ncbi:MAG: glycosyltransferase family 2 protein [Candidatus Hodarchaeota archaeon]
MVEGISTIILNYNGKEVLQKCLPSVIKSLEKVKKKSETIVVDNGSLDDSVQFLKSSFSSVKVVELSSNKLCAEGYNAGIYEAQYDHLFILNNDIEVEENCLVNLIDHFEDNPKLFAVTGLALYYYNKKTIDSGVRIGEFKRGIFEVYGKYRGEENKGQINQNFPMLFAECIALFDKNKIIELGGLDFLFPYNWQFADLSYRAWKRGYYSIVEPKALMYHMESADFKKAFTDRKRFYEGEKERFLFMWKNFSDIDILIKHLLLIPLNLMIQGIWRYRKYFLTYLFSFFAALKHFPMIYKKRMLERRFTKRTDQEVFESLNCSYERLKIN